jgi:hypothetical protein
VEAEREALLNYWPVIGTVPFRYVERVMRHVHAFIRARADKETL